MSNFISKKEIQKLGLDGNTYVDGINETEEEFITENGLNLEKSDIEPTHKLRKRNPNIKRLIIELPTLELDDFRVITSIYGRTQTEMVSRALKEFIANRKHLVEPYLKIRKEAEQELDKADEATNLKEREELLKKKIKDI